MTEEEAKAAASYASDGGLQVRGFRPGMGTNDLALYVHDPTRNAMFYFTRLRDLQLHLAENTERVRTRGKPAIRGKRRAGAHTGG